MEIAEAAKNACLIEASAYPKPGNVTPKEGFADLRYSDFRKAAHAIVPAIRDAAEGRPLGECVLHAIEDTREVCGSNVNLGIVLLLVPLAAAGKDAKSAGELSKRATENVLKSSVEDSLDFLRAVRVAEPFLPEHVLDARERKTEREVTKGKITFARLMRISSKSDMVATELLNGFQKSMFVYGNFSGKKITNGLVCQAYLRLLSKFRDTLVEKKHGKKKALWVKRRAREALALGGVWTEQGLREVLKFDRELREGGINPGSTADILCAGIFLALLFGESDGRTE